MSKKIKKPINKFEFGTDFQEAILHFIISDKLGYKAIELTEEDYFVLITHTIIFKAIKSFWKSKKRIPSKPILNERLRELYITREVSREIMEEDIREINEIVDKLYSNNVKDGDEILKQIIAFAQYVTLKDLQEEHDLLDFESYKTYSSKVQQVLSIGSEVNEDLGEFLVDGARDRIHQRALEPEGTPTPFWQLNRTLNAGLVSKAAMILIMAEQKRFKTGIAINWGRLEMRRKKVGAYVDFENGKIAIATRGDQGMIKATKKEILEGTHDDKMLKTYRKYKRIGSELIIKRFPAYNTTTLDIQMWFDRLRLEKGLKINYLICDYGDLGKASTGRTDDDKRISDFYVDLKNFAELNELDYVLTLSHVKRDKDTIKRKATKYLSSDVAKAVDKVRHADMILGLQENDEEKEAGVMRLEVLDQRDGSEGRVLLWVDMPKQIAREFSRKEVEEYYKQSGDYNADGSKKKAEKDSDI